MPSLMCALHRIVRQARERADLFDRVGGAVAGPAPHTTRHAGPHRAVQPAASDGRDPAAKARGRWSADPVPDPFPGSGRLHPPFPGGGPGRTGLAVSCRVELPRAALWLAVRPVPGSLQVLWPLLTSAAPSRPMAGPVARVLATRQISQEKHPFLRPAPARSPPSRAWESRVSPPRAGSPLARGLLSGCCSSGRGCGSSFLRTPPRGDALAFAERFRLPGP